MKRIQVNNNYPYLIDGTGLMNFSGLMQSSCAACQSIISTDTLVMSKLLQLISQCSQPDKWEQLEPAMAIMWWSFRFTLNMSIIYMCYCYLSASSLLLEQQQWNCAEWIDWPGIQRTYCFTGLSVTCVTTRPDYLQWLITCGGCRQPTYLWSWDSRFYWIPPSLQAGRTIIHHKSYLQTQLNVGLEWAWWVQGCGHTDERCSQQGWQDSRIRSHMIGIWN